MDISLSTVFLPNKRFNAQTAPGELAPVKEAGFTHIQWAYNWNSDYMYSMAELKDAGKVLREAGLKCKDIHASHGWRAVKFDGHPEWREPVPGDTDVASFDEDLRKKGSALVLNRLQLAAELGAESIVLHIFPPYHRFSEPGYRERHYEQAYKTLDENEAFARAHGIRICVENQTGIPYEYLTDEMDRFLGRYSDDYIGYCCDTGHLYLTFPEDPFRIPRRYVDRMHAIHLNDNLGPERPGVVLTCKPDAHMVMGDGIVDFDAFAKIVAESPYTFPVVGEFVMHGETEEVFLAHCYRELSAFTEKVMTLRGK